MVFVTNVLLLLLLIAAMAVWVVLPWQGALLLVVLFAAWLVLTRRGRQASSVANVGGPGDEGSVQLRGVSEQAWAVRPQVKIIAGRRFEPGLRELIVGRGAAKQFAGMVPDHEIRLGTQQWKVVGIFSSGD